MTSKQRIQAVINHRQPDRVAVDFGATTVTGIHCKVIAELREHYGLEKKPVKIVEPFQMLGEVDEELQQIIGTDCVPVFGPRNMFGISETEWHQQRTPWGQEVMISSGIDLTPDARGDIYVYPKNDRTAPPSGIMPSGCYFFNAIERQQQIVEERLDPADNLEEFGPISDSDLDYFTKAVDKAASTGKAVVASFGGTALGDVAMVPGLDMIAPKGIRSVAEWYMSTLLRPEYIQEIYSRQIDIAIKNYEKLWARVGDKVDVMYICGTDFGTQDSQFCSPETFSELWLPHYKRMTDWVHANTSWKIFKHSCGAILPLMEKFIEAGIDIINPVQINAKDMDSQVLKDRFGDRITFWGGGIDTQQVLPNGTPAQIKEHVKQQCEVLGQNGGFVFTSVHNVQANVATESLVAMIDALQEIRGIK